MITTFKTPELDYNENELTTPPVLVCDGIMGCGKTSAAINYMNSAPEGTYFIYVTPFLDEIERIRTACPGITFWEPKPQEQGSKLINFRKLVAAGKQIVTTHALFERLTKLDVELLHSRNYILIMDEVADVIESKKMDPVDYKLIFEGANPLASIDCVFRSKTAVFPVKCCNSFR